MKIGINTYLFTLRFKQQHVSLFKELAAIGYDGVELTYASAGDYDFKAVVAELKACNMKCSGICPSAGPDMNLRGSDSEFRNAVDFIKESVDAAAALGTDLVSGPLYSKIGYIINQPAEDMKLSYKRATEGLSEAAEYAETRNVYLAIEPLIRFETDFINTINDALRFLELCRTDRIKLHADTFHMNTEETDIQLALLEAGGKLFNIHASENNRGAPGTGMIDWQAIKRTLYKTGYNRFINVETFHPDVPEIAYAASVRRKTSESPFKLAKESHDFLRGLFRD